jgi:phage FluMu protein Com
MTIKRAECPECNRLLFNYSQFSGSLQIKCTRRICQAVVSVVGYTSEPNLSIKPFQVKEG